MRAIVKDFMGCASAEIVADKVALLLGHNGQGKTSSLLPIAAALRGGVPLGMQKTKAGMLVKTGAGSASILLKNDTSSVSVSWPKCERRSDGPNAPEASDIAVGAVKFPLMADKEKVELLRAILKCEPVKEDLFAALSAQGLSDKVSEVIWHSVEVDGWDAALERAKDKGRSLKSQWAIITGENYGEKKAAAWFPFGWENDLEASSADTLENEVTLARADLEDKIANQALSDDELARLERDAASLDNAKAQEEEAHKDLLAKNAAAKEARLAREKLPKMPNYDLVCPCCGKPLVYEFGKLSEIKQTLSADDRAALEQQILDADNALSRTLREVEAANRQFALCQSAFSTASAAAKRLAEKQGKAVQGAEVEEARNQVRKAEARLSAFNKYTEALRIHNSIVGNQLIIDVLEPDGIRRRSLEKGLSDFNDRLESLCKIAGWASVTIDGDMSVNYGGRPFVLCSESEKFRTVVTLQAAIAEYDGSDVLIVDAADILDNKGRSGLLKLLAKMSFESFVGMTVSNPDKAPNFKKLGIGHKYWVQSGICEEVWNG